MVRWVKGVVPLIRLPEGEPLVAAAAGGGFEGFGGNTSSIFEDIFNTFFGGEGYSRRTRTGASE